jgi:hypothetical protein
LRRFWARLRDEGRVKEVHAQLAKGSQERRGVALAEAAGVIAEDPIPAPVQPVFDPPPRTPGAKRGASASMELMK